MSDPDIGKLLSRSTVEVLERMFFAEVLGEVNLPEPDGTAGFSARVGFEGGPSGTLALSLSARLARTMAVDFLGLEQEVELTDIQAGEVVGELANMLCGSILSSIGSEQYFRLSSPVVQEFVDTAGGAVIRSFALEGGTLTVSLDWQQGQ